MHKSIPFAVLMVWHESGNLLDCYFCITNTIGFSRKSKHKIEYPNIDSSKVSLKAVLLYNGNTHPSIPSAHAVHEKDTCTNIQRLLEKQCYEDHQCNTRADLEVVAMLTSLQEGYMKFCFLCE